MGERLPVMSGAEVVRVLEGLGWMQRSQVGSHVIMTREGEMATLSVPQHKEIGRGLLRSIIRDAGLTVDEFVSRR